MHVSVSIATYITNIGSQEILLLSPSKKLNQITNFFFEYNN